MTDRFLRWFLKTARPSEGWLPLILLAGAVFILTGSLVEAEWTSESDVVLWTSPIGFILGVLLAKKGENRWLSWGLLIAYGGLIVLIRLGHLLPISLLWGSPAPFGDHLRSQLAIFGDRWGGWMRAVLNGGSSQETLPFSFGLGIGMWLLAAYAGWAAFRQRRPLRALTGLGVALAVNSYYSADSFYWILLYIPATVTAAAALQYANLERRWQMAHVGYPEQSWYELILWAGGAALLLLGAANSLPAFNVSNLAVRFQQSAIVQEAEETLERMFAGINPPRRPPPNSGEGSEEGILPRSFLLGNPPQLAEITVLTATVQSEIQPLHWRLISYDLYNGSGWARSAEREESVPAFAPLQHPQLIATSLVSQTVYWTLDQSAARAVLGLPTQFNEPIQAQWRGIDDFVAARGEGGAVYQTTSLSSRATPAQLRSAQLADTPAVILQRYAVLGEETPQRLIELGQEIVAGIETPYDQAAAIERFLRQYSYNLEIKPAPRGVDPVEYFLFESQEGYCDYYASAMALLARSVGLPARLGVGYLAQPADEQGVQTVSQLNAHSWAEIYLGAYGWIEFEPTAPFPRFEVELADDAGNSGEVGADAAEELYQPPPIPDARLARRRIPWRWLGLAGAAAGIALRRMRQKGALDPTVDSFARLRRHAGWLGVSMPASQTAAEFEQALLSRIQPGGDGLLVAGIAKIAALFQQAQYNRRIGEATDEQAAQAWRQIRSKMWRWQWRNWRQKNGG